MEFVELTTRPEKEEAFEIMREYIPLLNKSDFLQAFESEFFKNHKLFGLRSSGKLVSVAAVWLLLTGLMERLIWISAMVTTEALRSKGFGAALVDGLEDYARTEHFNAIWAHTTSSRAIKFWKQTVDFEQTATVLRKKIQPPPA
jgi:GNAT superfamily N-acetyltransferase